MNRFARWLLDLDTIPADAEGLRLVFERPMPGWLWMLVIMGLAAFAVWSYTRLAGSRTARIALAGARTLVLILVVLVISGPMLELPRISIEQDWLLVLADRSQSMSIADVEGDVRRVSRDEQLRNAIAEHGTALDTLEAEHQVVWLGFHRGAFNLAGYESGTIDLGEPTGDRTDVSRAIDQALQRASARPISGILLMTDGRAGDPVSRAVLRRLQADKVGVYAVPLGSPDPVGDLAIRRVDAPGRAFVRDKVPVAVELDRLGSAAHDVPATVRLIDITTGNELDSVELDGTSTQDRVTLIAEPELAGDATWQVVVETDRPDLIPDNNLKPFDIELIDRPLRILYIDGYPRWEYHFVKSLLVREESIESSVFLLSADRDFAQEGNLPITRLPRSPEEFAQFDAIIIGDVPGTFFNPEQLEMIRDHVASRGAGLLWIAGERYTPSSYVGTAGVLADLLPMRGGVNVPAIEQPVLMEPTPLADRLGVLRLATSDGVGWPDELRDPSYGWSSMYWAQRIEPGRLKPTAEVLAQTTTEIRGTKLPLVTFMRYGAGQTLYVATDEIWRWRYGRGEALPEQFWMQMIRMLGRESLSSVDARAVLTLGPRRVEAGQPVRIEVRVLEQQLAATLRGALTAVVLDTAGNPITELSLARVDGDDERFAMTYLPSDPGAFQIVIDDPALRDLELRDIFDVVDRDDELRRPETDHEMLADLAAATGGAVVELDDMDRLPEILPNRSVRTENPLSERIWDTPLFFALLLLVLTVEWIGRKAIRLA